MAFRRVNITRDRNIQDQEHLSRHPDVRNYLRFPWGYTLFEFYDPIFENEDVANPGRPQSPEIRSRLAELVTEERKLLWPLYKGRPEHWQGNQLVLMLETGIYRVIDKEKGKWPWFGSSPGWEKESRIKIKGRVGTSTPASRESLEKEFGEWVSWASSTGQLTSRPQLTFHDDSFDVVCSFTDHCGESCIGLYLLLAKTEKATGIEAMGFFLPKETTFKFYEIGGTGVIDLGG